LSTVRNRGVDELFRSKASPYVCGVTLHNTGTVTKNNPMIRNHRNFLIMFSVVWPLGSFISYVRQQDDLKIVIDVCTRAGVPGRQSSARHRVRGNQKERNVERNLN